jgi:small-conductance mechanosensitive channel
MDIEQLPNRDLADRDLDSDNPPHRRWLWLTLVAGVAIVATVLGVLLAYSNSSASAWQREAQQKSADLAAMTSERNARVAELRTMKAELATTTVKYNDAAARIRALADEKAQVGDQAAALAEATALSQTVTTELDTCVEQLQQLQGYLINFDSYNADAVVTVLQEVNAGCNGAQEDNAALAKMIASL